MLSCLRISHCQHFGISAQMREVPAGARRFLSELGQSACNETIFTRWRRLPASTGACRRLSSPRTPCKVMRRSGRTHGPIRKRLVQPSTSPALPCPEDLRLSGRCRQSEHRAVGWFERVLWTLGAGVDLFMLHIYVAPAEKSRRRKGHFSATAPETLIEYRGDPVQAVMPKPIYWLQTREAA
jgi:hypothetical protein